MSRKSKQFGKKRADKNEDGPLSPPSYSNNDIDDEVASDLGSEDEVNEEANENVEYHDESTSEASEVDEEIEGELDDERNSPIGNQPKTQFKDTDITFLVSSSIGALSTSQDACCSKSLGSFIQNKAQDFLQGKRLIKDIKFVQWDNRFPLSLGVDIEGISNIATNLIHSNHGGSFHLICAPGQKSETPVTVASVNTGKAMKFVKDFAVMSLENIRDGVVFLEKECWIPIGHPLEKLIEQMESRKGGKTGRSGNYIHAEKDSAEAVIQKLESDMKKSMSIVDFKNIKVSIKPAFPTSNSSDKKEISDISKMWLSTQEWNVASTVDEKAKRAMQEKVYQCYVTVRFTHCSA